jgi:addiction module HigA family antidote
MAEATTTGLGYSPDYVVRPGETLLEVLEKLGMSQAELAERIGRPKKTINEIVKGKAAITPETALQLERAFRIPASFWNNLQRNYEAALARLLERKRLENHVSWLEQIPIKAMVKLGWVRSFKDKLDQLEEVLAFFGVASPEQWREVWAGTAVAFRQTTAFKSDPRAVAAWLRRGELEAHEIDCAPFDKDRFLAVLSEVRSLTVESPEIFQAALKEGCAAAGVAVAFVPQLPGARVSGATRWMSPEKALIQLSLRYKSDDQLWFTFFHESAHILLHGKRRIFLEGDAASGSEREEEQAHRFAADFLIPPDEMAQFLEEERPSTAAIRGFAQRVGIAPGIVVGRLQHDGVLEFSHCNRLKRRLQWSTEQA